MYEGSIFRDLGYLGLKVRCLVVLRRERGRLAAYWQRNTFELNLILEKEKVEADERERAGKQKRICDWLVRCMKDLYFGI